MIGDISNRYLAQEDHLTIYYQPHSQLSDNPLANTEYENRVEQKYSQKTLKRHHTLNVANVMRLGWQAIKNFK